jgi:uncharacterized protein (TIGR00251 family)
VRLAVHLMPNAKKTEVVGLLDDMLKIRLRAAPVEGKANEALIRFLAETLDVPRSAVTIKLGQLNKNKVLEIRSARLTPALMDAALIGSGDAGQRVLRSR